MPHNSSIASMFNDAERLDWLDRNDRPTLAWEPGRLRHAVDCAMLFEIAGLHTKYGRADVDYDTWYSQWPKDLAKRHTLPELLAKLGVSRAEAKQAAHAHRRAVEATHSMTSQSQRRAQTGNVAQAAGDTAIALRSAIEIHVLFPEHAKPTEASDGNVL